jgi:hypothetical protein
MNKAQQRTFGITENLLRQPVPRFYGAGKHKVQLAYITPDEANLLAELDLHNSNPPNPGPAGIPNFDDPGTGMSGVAASAAEAGSQASASDAAQAAAEGVGGFVTGGGGMVTGGGGLVTSGGMGIGPGGSVDYGNPDRAFAIGPSPNLGAGSPSADRDRDRDKDKDKGFLTGIMSNLTPQRMIGSLIGSALFGPLGGLLGGIIGGTYGDDDPSNNFGGVMMNALRQDFSNILGNPVPNFGELNTTTQIGDTFSMPAPSGLRGTTVFGTMPNVTAAPIDSISQPTNAVDSFGNPVTFGRTNFDPVVQTQPLASPTTMDILGAEGLLNTPVIDEGTTMRSPVFDEGVLEADRFNMPVIQNPDFNPLNLGVITPGDLQYFNYMRRQPTDV